MATNDQPKAKKWFNCKPITEYASPTLCHCRKDEDFVIFFNDDNCWIRLPAAKAKQHFQITGESHYSDELEENYQWSLEQSQLAISSGGSKSDIPSTPSECEESLDPGLKTE